jgi:hypothetical protein
VRLRWFYRVLYREGLKPMEETPVERPSLRCLVALSGDYGRPKVFRVVSILDLDHWKRLGFEFVALDPMDESAWLAWRKEHPEV